MIFKIRFLSRSWWGHLAHGTECEFLFSDYVSSCIIVFWLSELPEKAQMEKLNSSFLQTQAGFDGVLCSLERTGRYFLTLVVQQQSVCAVMGAGRVVQHRAPAAIPSRACQWDVVAINTIIYRVLGDCSERKALFKVNTCGIWDLPAFHVFVAGYLCTVTFLLVAGWDNWPIHSLGQPGSLSQAAGTCVLEGKMGVTNRMC